MIAINNPEDCCGCTACYSICPRDAIIMKPDTLGFVYPQIDEEKCIDCGLCDNVCSFNDKYDISQNFDIPMAYAARHKDIMEVMKSRSGAAFAAISDYILDMGGVVYGAGYKNHFQVVHKKASSKCERDEFRGSKYVQSCLEGIFRDVKSELMKGTLVLFSGTPCQAAGLKSYIGGNLNNHLYLVDIICHGVPGPLYWKDFISYIEKKRKSRLTFVDFRDKDLYGWTNHKETFKFDNDENKVSFKFPYYNHVSFRYSCNVCHYTNLKRPSDITLGDYWGWERTDSSINKDDKGCSLVLCNTEKGLQLFEAIKDKMQVVPADLKNIMQTHLSRPVGIHPQRAIFEEAYAKHGFEYAIQIVGLAGWRFYLKYYKHKIRTLLNKYRSM